MVIVWLCLFIGGVYVLVFCCFLLKLKKYIIILLVFAVIVGLGIYVVWSSNGLLCIDNKILVRLV